MLKHYLLSVIALGVAAAGLAEQSEQPLLPAARAYVGTNQKRQYDYEYDQYGRTTKVTHKDLIYPDLNSITVYEYTDYKPGLYSKAKVWIMPPDGKERTLIYHFTRTYDNLDRVTSQGELYLQSTEPIANIDFYDYTHSEKGMILNRASFKVNPETLEYLDMIDITGYRFSKGANRYFKLKDDDYEKVEVFDDCVITYRKKSSGKISDEDYVYYADGKEICRKTKSYSSNSEDFSWSGSKTEVTVNGSLKTEIIYTVDSKTGEWVYSHKTETSGDFNTPGVSGYVVESYWMNNTWNETRHETYSWIGKNLRKCVSVKNGNSVSYVRYDNNGKAEGAATMLEDNIYFVSKDDIQANCTYYYYYNTSGSLLRQIRADHKYLFVDQYRELIYGEWVVPTQAFYFKNRKIFGRVNSCDSYGNPKGLDQCIMTDGNIKSVGFTLFGDAVNGIPSGWSRFEYGLFDKIEDYGRGEVKWINDNVISILYHDGSIDTSKKYEEYDIKQRAVHDFQQQSNQWVYSSTSYPYHLGTYAYEDGAYIEYSYKYDRATNLMTITRKATVNDETGNKSQTTEQYDPNTETWYLTGREEVKITPVPQWRDYKLYPGTTYDTDYYREIYAEYSITKSDGESYMTVNKRLNPDMATTKTDRDEAIYSLNPTSGEMELTKHEYVTYENSANLNARHVIRENDGKRTITSIIYELDGRRRPVLYRQEEIREVDGNQTGKSGFETRMGYDDLDRPIFLNDQNREIRIAYDKSYDLINDFNNIEEHPELVPGITIEGLNIRSNGSAVLTLYATDGRTVAKSTNGSLSAPSPGIYLLTTENGACLKIQLRY